MKNDARCIGGGTLDDLLCLGGPPPPASDNGSLLDGPHDSLDPVEQLANRLVHALWVVDETFPPLSSPCSSVSLPCVTPSHSTPLPGLLGLSILTRLRLLLRLSLSLSQVVFLESKPLRNRHGGGVRVGLQTPTLRPVKLRMLLGMPEPLGVPLQPLPLEGVRVRRVPLVLVRI